jgi:hypothetical protein
MRKGRAFILLLLVATAAFAQNGITGHPSWQIKPSFNQGFILVHRISIGHLVKGYPAIYEVNISKPTLGNKLWHIENNHPDVGITMQCLDYKNPGQLGFVYAIAPYIEIPFREADHPARMVLRLCWGPAYVTKKFNIVDNHKNIAIGSNLNAYVQFKWFWQIRLSERLRFEPGFAFTHVSNGKYRNPNLGLNVVSINAAMNILFPAKKIPAVTAVDSSARARKKNELMFFAAAGVNERLTNTELLQVYVVSAAYQRNVGNQHKFSGGLDFFYDENFQIDHELRTHEQLTGFDRLRVSARVGYSYNVGRISFPFEVGYYIFQKDSPDGNIVNRIGVRYYGAKGLVAHFGMRSHLAVAYNFEFGLGYRLYL